MYRVYALIVAGLTLSCTAATPDKPYHFADPSQKTTFAIEIADSVPYLPVQIAGQRLWFALDTGSSRMLIDKTKAAELGMKLTPADSIQGAGAGRIPLQKVDNVVLQLPGVESHHATFFAADMHGPNQITAHHFDGILGYEFLSRFAVTLDYANKKLTIAAPEAFVTDRRDEAIPIEFKGGWPIVRAEMTVADGVVMQDKFLIDSGSSDSVDHPIATSMQGARPTTTGVGFGSPGTGKIGTLPRFKLGSFSFRDVSIACCGATEDTSRLVGGAILSKFTITFDYPQHRILLRSAE